VRLRMSWTPVTWMAGLAAASLVTSLAVAGPAAASPSGPTTAARVALPDPVAASRLPGVSDAGATGRRVEVSVRLYLAGRDPAAEARFATAVSTPGSGRYGRFISPARFAARFGPTRAQVAAVTGWAGSAGLRVTGVNEHDVAARGAAPGRGGGAGDAAGRLPRRRQAGRLRPGERDLGTGLHRP
jgi:hypothetical protein